MAHRLAGRSFASAQASLTVGSTATDPVVTSGAGPPTTSAPVGSIYIDRTNAALYQNQDGASTGWGAVFGKRELNLGSVALGANVNNWAPPGYAGEDLISVATSTGGGTSITGIDLGVYQVPGKEIVFFVTGSNAITFLTDNVNSLAANRIRGVQSASVINSACRLRYMAAGIWRVIDKW